MKTVFIHNIQTLFGIIEDRSVSHKSGSEMRELSSISNAYVRIENGMIHSFGTYTDATLIPADAERIDAQGGMVLPAFVDFAYSYCICQKPRRRV